jgi:hypothetical protein
MSLMNRVTRFARGPEGRSALQKAMDRFGGGKGGGRSTRGRSSRRTAGRGRARTKRTR